jgi:hypothetical protein
VEFNTGVVEILNTPEVAPATAGTWCPILNVAVVPGAMVVATATSSAAPLNRTGADLSLEIPFTGTYKGAVVLVFVTDTVQESNPFEVVAEERVDAETVGQDISDTIGSFLSGVKL